MVYTLQIKVRFRLYCGFVCTIVGLASCVAAILVGLFVIKIIGDLFFCTCVRELTSRVI